MNSTIGCCIMSMNSPKTLLQTLKTYKTQDLLSFFDQTLILFQEISDCDKDLAKEFAIPYIATQNNVGIYGGIKILAKAMNTDYILLLENDCILVESKEEIIKQLTLVKYRLDNKQVDLYRLRHRWLVGEKFDVIKKYIKYHHNYPNDKNNNIYKLLLRLIRPDKYRKLIGASIYVHEDPKGYLYDRYIFKQREGDFIVDSAVLPWTNQSIICSRQWLLTEILPYVENNPSKRMVNNFQDIEKSLNSRWWQRKHFKIGVGTGLFSHRRLD